MNGLAPRFRARLESEPIAWLTTVSAAGVPSSSPVWFLLRLNGDIVVHSKDPSVRITNLAGNPNVNLHLEGNGRGGEILALTGTAVVDTSLPRADNDSAYIAKYADFLERSGWTPQWFAQHYPTPILISVSHHIGW